VDRRGARRRFAMAEDSSASSDFTIGVEEEYQLVDPTTRALSADVEAIFAAAAQRAPGEVAHELQQTQIEIGTPVCTSLAEVREALVRLRSEMTAAVATRGLVIVAAGTHPFAAADGGVITDAPEYRAIAGRYAQLAREQIVFGCHVHVGVTDREVAIAAMNGMRAWLPVILALSASSPYWNGRDTGYSSYRSVVFGRWPTAGPAEHFSSRAEFDEVVAQLLATGGIDDRARLYWDVRPSAKYETLEVRIADVCTDMDHAVMIAGLCGGLVRRTVADALAGRGSDPVRPEIVRAARWRAARYGIGADLIDVVGGRSAPAADVVGQFVEFIGDALEEWGERSTVVEMVAQTLRRGTSAAAQRNEFRRRGEIVDVVDWLVAATASH
jgi:glutamate---cysteine ligase / carboxylate-amine ligase